MLTIKNKIYGIGLSRTGTTSLCKAMSILGYNSQHGLRYIEEIEKYQFINDIIISGNFEFLDFVTRNGKFILTVRNDVEEWLDSCEYRIGSNRGETIRRREIRFRLYGVDRFDREKFRVAYHDYMKKVINHFKGREDLLIMNIIGGDGWEKLCPFLEKEIPIVNFPHKNKR
jgi:hypothetical protein